MGSAAVGSVGSAATAAAEAKAVGSVMEAAVGSVMEAVVGSAAVGSVGSAAGSADSAAADSAAGKKYPPLLLARQTPLANPRFPLSGPRSTPPRCLGFLVKLSIFANIVANRSPTSTLSSSFPKNNFSRH